MFASQAKPPLFLTVVLSLILELAFAAPASAAGVSGTSALEFTRRAVGFGPRPPGSAANHALQNYILTELQKDGCDILEDAFKERGIGLVSDPDFYLIFFELLDLRPYIDADNTGMRSEVAFPHLQ